MGSTKSKTEEIDPLDEGAENIGIADLGLQGDSTNPPWPCENPGIQRLSGRFPKFERTYHRQGYPYSSEHTVHALVFLPEPSGVRRSRDTS